ncbi:MAG: HEAT repeat domain-containing protein [Candidatus Micrarchaeota archaeon]
MAAVNMQAVIFPLFSTGSSNKPQFSFAGRSLTERRFAPNEKETTRNLLTLNSRYSTIQRCEACMQLGRNKVQEAIPRLFELLLDDDPGIRFAAAVGLSYFDTYEIPRMLLQRLPKERDPKTIEALIAAITSISKEGVVRP